MSLRSIYECLQARETVDPLTQVIYAIIILSCLSPFLPCLRPGANNLIKDCLVSIVRDAGFSATTRVPAIEVQDQHIRADIYIPQMQVDGCRGLCIDVSRVWHRG